MIFVVDNQFDRLGVIQHWIEAKRIEELNGENTLNFSAILDEKTNRFIHNDTIFEHGGDLFDMALFDKTSNEDGTYTVDVEADHISYRLNREEYNLESFNEQGSPSYILEKILEGTGFTGTIEFTDVAVYAAKEGKSRRQLLMEYAALLEGDLVFHRFEVHIVRQRGSSEPRRVVKDLNVKVISQSVNKRRKNESGRLLTAYKCTSVHIPEAPYYLGDSVTLIDRLLGINEELRVVMIEYNPYDRTDTVLTFGDYDNPHRYGLEDSFYDIENSTYDSGSGGGGGWGEVTPKLYWDYNKEPIRVGQLEQQVAKIEVDATDILGTAQGHFQLTFMSNRDTEVAIRIYDNDVQQLYTPIYKQVKRGYNELPSPHFYIELVDDIHIFTVTMQARYGECYIEARQVAYSIDLFATERPPVFHDVRDVSIFEPEGRNQQREVYAIVMSDENKPAVFKTRYAAGRLIRGRDLTRVWLLDDISNPVQLAIEFDGVFTLPIGNEIFNLITKEKPQLFWTDEDDILWTQYGNEINTRRQLAENVLTISTCRGWNSREHPDVDTGLIVAYIKQGGIVAYRCFMNTPALQGVWAGEEILTEAGDDNTYVHVHRLNDYRIGFAVTGIDKEFVSERLLSGQGIKPEHNHIGISTITNFAQLRTTEPVTSPLILHAEFFNNDRYRVVITGNYPFALKSDINPHNLNLSITQSGANKPITSLEIIDGALHLTFSATVSPSPDTVVRANALTYLQYILEDGQRPYWPNADITIPGEPLRYSFPEHNVIGIRAETRFEQIRINYPSRELPGEHNVIGISANVASFTHTHIAYNYITHEQPPGEHNKIGISAAVVTFNMVPIGTDPL